MTDNLTLSLAKLQGTREGLVLAKRELDHASERVGASQAANAAAIAEVVSQLQGIGGVRQTSLVDDRANFERTVGQTAVALAVKADPAITLEAAMALWTLNATAYRESIGRTTPTQNPEGCLEEYLLDMQAAGNIPEPTWEAFRAWIYATPLDKLGI